MLERRAIRVRGIVQGVGFRPFVHRLASDLGLGGTVANHSGDVVIEIEGDNETLDCFLARLTDLAPRLARIDDVSWTPLATTGEKTFQIGESQLELSSYVSVSSDIATCADCRRELFDPSNRRYRYPFINCTNCGPRLTIITGAPYDRSRTTMSAFEMCPACRTEYENPQDRRFHAQPIACAECGPSLRLLDASGEAVWYVDPLRYFAKRVLSGEIGALKGIGGYHLVCDARNDAAVGELRRRKSRDEKPFAVMVHSIEAAEALCVVGEAERELLKSSGAPIVLLRKRPECRVAPSVAPQNPMLGVMLPYTPLHHLLLQELGVPLVMTSGNRSDEPMAYLDDDAIVRLRDIADLFLCHNRPIRVRCDDSVTRVVGETKMPIRRSRGDAPRSIMLATECRYPILAVGGQLKATFTLAREHHAFMSQHLGDLDQLEAFQAFEKDVVLYEDLFDLHPAVIAHDLHPDYASTRYAADRAAREGLGVVAVQHHHAHLASCMTENGLTEPVIGVTFDGTGYGTDGAIWGGEFLIGDARDFRRMAHLRYVGLPGGKQAIRQPWRMALAHLLDAGGDCLPFTSRRNATEMRTMEMLLHKKLNTPDTSSMGRLFDAVACLSGGRDHVSYEGQAAIELEWLATDVEVDGTYPFELCDAPTTDAAIIIDTRPLMRAVAGDVVDHVSRRVVARRFHSTVVEIIRVVCRRLRDSIGLDAVVLTGGVFLNALLTSEAMNALRDDGFRVFQHRLVPPNDGGVSLGQAAIAAAWLQRPENTQDNSVRRFANAERVEQNV